MTNKKLILIFSLIFLVFSLCAVILTFITPDEDKAVITVNGEFYREMNLNEDGMFVINAKGGHNIVNVKNGEIFIVEATCPDKLCVRHGKLRSKYDSIVCLPHKIVIEYKTDSKDIDAVAGR